MKKHKDESIMNTKKFTGLWAIITAVYGHEVCAKVLSKVEAVEFFYDLEFIKAIAYKRYRSEEDKRAIFLKNKSILLKKYAISNDDFKETLQYYFSHTADLLEVYKKVIEKLSSHESGT